MSRVLVVSRTRMRQERVCVGGHALDDGFRSLRLLRKDGSNMFEKDPLAIGAVWDLDYEPRAGVSRPHVEDVLVRAGKRVDTVDGLRELLLENTRPWKGPPSVLFEGHVAGTPSGTAYVPPEEPLPGCSTGYWIPDAHVHKSVFEQKVRYQYAGGGDVSRMSWVGMEDAPDVISPGTLVRVSLARLWSPPSAPSGYYVQVSGVY